MFNSPPKKKYNILSKKMKHKKTILLFCCLLLGWWTVGLKAQNGTVAAGGDLTGSGGSVSHSIGQINYITLTGSGGTVTQGLQQPYEIWVITGVEVEGVELSMAVYPNPAADYVMLQVDDPDIFLEDHLTYQLFDISGKLLDQQTLDNSTTQIALAQYTRGIYFLKVMVNGQELKSFKILKNQ
jgi:hypothetical protein